MIAKLENVHGNTYCIVTKFNRIPFYKLNNSEVVIMDSGLHNECDEIILLLKKLNYRVRAILTTHAHVDHTGNHAFLQNYYNAKVYMSLFDAGISSSIEKLKGCFYNMNHSVLENYVSPMVCNCDEIILPEQVSIEIDGACFEILRLPGHAAEHLGFVTPDNVAYLGDLLMSESVLKSVRLPYTLCWQKDFESKQIALNMNYSHYILSHNGIYSNIRPSVEKNLQVQQSQINAFADLTEREQSMEELISAVICKLGLCVDSVFKFSIVERSVRSYVEYLLDIGRLSIIISESTQKYILNKKN